MAEEVITKISQSASKTIQRSSLLRNTIDNIYEFMFENRSPKAIKYLQYIGIIYLLKKSISLSINLGSYIFSSVKYLNSRIGFNAAEFRDRFGIKYWTLIVGADSDIGKVFSKQLSSLGFDLILVGTNHRSLNNLGNQVTKINPFIKVQIITVPLFYKDAIQQIQKQTKGLDIGLIINNTQLFHYQSYEKMAKLSLLQSMNCNVNILIDVCKLFVPKMKKRAYKGGIINVTSGFGVIPIPYTGLFSVSNCYADVFSRSLSEQLRGKVQILSLKLFTVLKGDFKKNKAGYQCVAAALKSLGKVDSTYTTFSEQLFMINKFRDEEQKSLATLSAQINESVPIKYQI